MESVITFLDIIKDILNFVNSKILITVILLSIWWLIRKLINKIIEEKIDKVKKIHKAKKKASIITTALIIFLLCLLWVKDFTQFIAILSAGLSITLKEPIENIFGYFFILLKKPFKEGDRIEINGVSGDVISITAFQFTVIEIGNWVNPDQSTGRIIHVPNGKIFSKDLANYTKIFNYIWDELEVLITFESNWVSAKKILLNIVNKYCLDESKNAGVNLDEISKKHMIYYKNLTPIVYTDVKNSGILLTVRYLCKPQQKRIYRSLIWEEMLSQFNTNKDIEFAYQTIKVK
ncbi:mechanosensitive ion channel family protein [Maledivibacter halophilus]|uniref:Small-conductance mechanosensitive channel n=1 Tax=Maledivibacter halophilus TaxID=36842 RepID=A0A1T5KN91_9FIRM|nr:mechanosensitive ion channel domain-containing protein [Maledivibacter halophilus]SKC65214.1 Small-conductance mechanosensitive channel [Maledivibacter halophilus]